MANENRVYYEVPFRGTSLYLYRDESNRLRPWRACLPGVSCTGSSVSEAIGDVVSWWQGKGSHMVGHWYGPETVKITVAEVIDMMPDWAREYMGEDYFAAPCQISAP